MAVRRDVELKALREALFQAQEAGKQMRAELDTLRREMDVLHAIAKAAALLCDDVEEWECDGLGLFAPHGSWEPLHEALEALQHPVRPGFGCNPLGKCSEPRCEDCPEGILERT